MKVNIYKVIPHFTVFSFALMCAAAVLALETKFVN
jgi:hypothetical protein